MASAKRAVHSSSRNDKAGTATYDLYGRSSGDALFLFCGWKSVMMFWDTVDARYSFCRKVHIMVNARTGLAKLRRLLGAFRLDREGKVEALN